MDDRRNTDNSVAAGVGDQLHDGGTHSHCAGDCRYCFRSWFYPEAVSVV